MNQHPSKQASCKHKASLEKAEIQLTIARADLQTLLSIQEVDSPMEHAKKIDKAQKQIGTLKRQLK